MTQQHTIETAIHETLDDPQFNDQTPIQINQGDCEAFAQRVTERLDTEVQIVTTADIVDGDPTCKPEPWHVWVTDTDQLFHYDAETPEGVATWSNLMFWNRIMFWNGL